MIPFLAAKLLVAALVLAACRVVGAPLAALLPTRSRREHAAVAGCVGMALLAQALDLLALAGRLGRASLLLALAAGILVSVASAWRAGRLGGRPSPIRRRGDVLLALGASLPFFVLACYPPLGFDETLYHLPLARVFARTGGLPFVPELRVPAFPPLSEVLSASMLLFFDDVSTHLVSLAASLLTAALLLVWGERIGSRLRGELAAALHLGAPLVAYLSGTSYVEPLLALFATAAAFTAARLALEGGRGWAFACAGFTAAAAGTKYLGLFFVAAGAAGIAVAGGAWRERAAAQLGYAMVAAIGLAPVYGRIVALTGNPLFPLLPEIFGSTAWDPLPVADAAGLARLAERGRLLWDAAAHPSAAAAQAPFSPFLLALAPLLVLAPRPGREDLGLLACALAYLLAVPPNARYLVPVLPIASFVVAGGLERAWRSRAEEGPHRARVAAAVLLAPGWLYAVLMIARNGPPPATAAERETFLAARVPAYAAVAELNRRRGPGVRVYAVHLEHMAYWVDGTMLGDWSGPGSFREILPLASDPAVFAARLRALGVTHLVLAAAEPLDGLRSRPGFARHFRPLFARNGYEVIELREPAAGGGAP